MIDSSLIDRRAEREFVMPFVINYARKYYPEVDGVVDADMFDDPMCRDIWRAIGIIEQRNDEINLMSVYTELQRIGSDVSLIDLTSTMPNNSASFDINTALYLRDLYNRREMVKLMSNEIGNVVNLSEPIEDIVARIKKATDRISILTDKMELDMNDMMTNLLRQVEDRKNGTAPDGTKSGFEIVDEIGLQPTDLDVIAGESSMGKTAFALCIALNVAKNGTPIAIYSLEMGKEQLAARMVSIESDGLLATDVQYNKLSDNEYSMLFSTATGLMPLPIYFDMSSTYNIDKLCSSIRKMVYNYGVNGVVIDYLQLLTSGSKRDINRVEELASISRQLKNLAKDMNIFVILLSQLNRGKEGSNPIPTMKRLRGSGEIEESADNIYMVWRPERYGREFPGGWREYDTHNRALIIRAKGRNGGPGERLVDFIPERTKFIDSHYKKDDSANYKSDDTDDVFG